MKKVYVVVTEFPEDRIITVHKTKEGAIEYASKQGDKGAILSYGEKVKVRK